MSLEGGVLGFGRTQAEARMRGACTITRTVKGALDETTGEYAAGVTTTVYSGVCRLKFSNMQGNDVDAQLQLLTKQDAILSLPVGSSGSELVDDLVTITADVDDAAMVGRVFRIAGLHGGTVTARRYPVEVVS